jgi:biotin transport system substrate-specific component
VPPLAYSIPKARSNLAYDALVVVAGSLVVAALAQLSITLPFTPVPITGQTLGVLVVGASLGALRGGLSLLVYIGWGAIGLPFFAEGNGGTEFLGATAATGGYLWGFIVAAAVVGWLAERGWDRNFGSAIGTFVLGEVIVFAFGVIWLAQAIDVPIEASTPCSLASGKGCDALQLGLYPFVIGDLLKLLIAAGALPAAWKLLGRDSRA